MPHRKTDKLLQGNPVERVKRVLGPLHPAIPRKHWVKGTCAPASRDKKYLSEIRADAERWGDDLSMQMRGLPLADFECSHGKLPGDPVIECGCWLPDISQLPRDLLDRIPLQGLSRAEAIRLLLSEGVYEIVKHTDTARAA